MRITRQSGTSPRTAAPRWRFPRHHQRSGSATHRTGTINAHGQGATTHPPPQSWRERPLWSPPSTHRTPKSPPSGSWGPPLQPLLRRMGKQKICGISAVKPDNRDYGIYSAMNAPIMATWDGWIAKSITTHYSGIISSHNCRAGHVRPAKASERPIVSADH